MSSRPYYVFDTNTIISAFLFEEGIPGRELNEALDQGELILSMEVAEELAKVLRVKKNQRGVSGSNHSKGCLCRGNIEHSRVP